MLEGIKELLNTLGEALSFADAGEMLTGHQKSRVLGQKEISCKHDSVALSPRIVLAGDNAFTPDALERAIAMCHEKNAILDLLCVSGKENDVADHLASALPRLEIETGLDFQITRRYGDLLVVTKTYVRARNDILKMLVVVNEDMRSRAGRKQVTEKFFQTKTPPAANLEEDSIRA